MTIKLPPKEECNYKMLDNARFDAEVIKWATEKFIAAANEDSENKEGFASLLRMLSEFDLDTIEKYCESEIEKQVAYALLFHSKIDNVFAALMPYNTYCHLFVDDPDDKADKALRDYYAKTDLLVVPNFWLQIKDEKKIRVDFLINFKANRKRKRQWAIIECDSFMYHSSSSQLTQEKQRERLLSECPWKVLRFSGGEIHKNPTKVAREILDFCFN